MNPTIQPLTETVTERLRRIIDIHFDPRGGSRYWLDKAAQLGLDPRKDINAIENLALLGPMDEDALATLPVEDFVPQSLLHRKKDLIFAETAGTLGSPKFAVHLAEEFHAAFVAPFVAAADRVDFPKQQNWLFVGPTGPHIIGKAARSCAQALGSPDIFTVDFDPRWAKKLPGQSFAAKRLISDNHSYRPATIRNSGY